MAGFFVTLRQCRDSSEKANFGRAKNLLALAARDATDERADERRDAIKTWAKAESRLRQRSVHQLVRDRFVQVEGWKGFDIKEPRSPHEILELLGYGDLVHWDPEQHDVAFGTLQADATLLQFQFFVAATGLAHLYVGFGELAETLIA